MSRDNSFKDFVLDQLGDLPALACRAMFGGYGLYAGAVFFGIIFRGKLYFKTSDETRARYLRCRMKPFRPSATQTLKTYYEIPAEVLEDAEALAAWARESIQAAGNA